MFRTHTTERVRSNRTKTILAPAQAVRIPFDSERCRSDGTRAANGRMLTTSATILIDSIRTDSYLWNLRKLYRCQIMGKFVCDRSAVRIVVKSRQNKSKEKRKKESGSQ